MSNDSSQSCKHWSSIAKEYNPIKIGSIDGTDTIPHDKALVRALVSKYKPNKKVKGKPSHTIFVGRLSSNTTKDIILEKFSKFGDITSCRLVKDIVTGESKCYAFVEYDSSKSAYKAYKYMNSEFIEGNRILVDFEMERTMPGWKPRRLGGGFGGKKESGQLRFGCRTKPFQRPILINVKAVSSSREGSTYYR